LKSSFNEIGVNVVMRKSAKEKYYRIGFVDVDVDYSTEETDESLEEKGSPTVQMDGEVQRPNLGIFWIFMPHSVLIVLVLTFLFVLMYNVHENYKVYKERQTYTVQYVLDLPGKLGFNNKEVE
jgi:hypothetical protein